MRRTIAVVLLSGTLLATMAPSVLAAGSVTVHNPWLVNDRVADTHNLNTMAATYINAYTPGGVVPPASDEDKAINIYNNQKRRLYHWADEPPTTGGSISDPTYNQNVFGWSLCGRHANQACTITKAAGLGQRIIGLPGHWIYEVQYSDGTWHAFDTMTTMYLYNKGTPRRVASCAEMKADTSLLANAIIDGRACPGFLLCGDTTDWYQSAVNTWSDSGNGGVASTTWTGNMDLRSGQSFKRTWESWLSQHPTIGGGGTPPYHHEANKGGVDMGDDADTPNYPYWEPYALDSAGNSASGISYSKTYRRWANGTDTLTPNFRTAAYQAMLEPASSGIATYFTDGLTPDLHAGAVGVTGSAIFKINVPYYITDASFSGDFVKTNAGDICKVYTSNNGTTWTEVYSAPVGTTSVTNQPLRTQLFGTWTTWYIKVELNGTVAKTDVGVSNLVVTTIFEHNKGAMAYLDKGVNNITLTFDNPAELAASGNAIHVVYKWKEYDGTGWTIDKKFETYTTTSPTDFTISTPSTAGSKVPRTEYVLLEVVEPPADATAPAAVTDLRADLAYSFKIPLTWTAAGDDGSTGQANGYELRYSTNPITDDASFNAATLASGTISPLTAGATEHFSAYGLQASTTYYFALKVIDEVGNRSALSNVLQVTTPPADPTAPEAVTTLTAKPTPTTGTVNVTWTAPADYGYGGVGPYSAYIYELRYSTSPIDAGNWAAAMRVSGLSLPKAHGSPETLAVSGLASRTTYYFAITSADETGNISVLSNIASVRTTGQLVLMPIADAGLYGGGSDYSNRGTGGRFDIGATQDGLLKFDLAGKLVPGEMVTGATLQLYSARGGYSFTLPVVAYPLALPWQEGVGNAGASGDTGFPWGPASIGDAVFAYQQTTAVGLGTGSFAGKTVATAGIPWNTPGARGIGTDVLDRQLFSLTWSGSVSGGDPIGKAMPAIELSADGICVVRGWSTGAIANNGLNMWATSTGSAYAALTTREFAGNRPQLVLTIGLAGDINVDTYVNVGDLQALVAAWASQASPASGNWSPNADLNGDGYVNVGDLQALVANWGASLY